MNRVVLLATLLAAGAVLPAIGQPSLAADQMTIDQMIKSLSPPGSTAEPTRRGIRPPTFSANPQVAPRRNAGTPTDAVSSAQDKVKSVSSINLNVQFRTDSAELSPETVHILDDLGHALSSEALAPYRFQIVGHTDSPGSADFNKLLSQRRAQAVVEYIVTKYGVAPERLDAYGVGSEDPLVPTPKSERRNRRVQIVNIGG